MQGYQRNKNEIEYFINCGNNIKILIVDKIKSEHLSLDLQLEIFQGEDPSHYKCKRIFNFKDKRLLNPENIPNNKLDYTLYEDILKRELPQEVYRKLDFLDC